jgi:hypothetical protein
MDNTGRRVGKYPRTLTGRPRFPAERFAEHMGELLQVCPHCWHNLSL